MSVGKIQSTRARGSPKAEKVKGKTGAAPAGGAARTVGILIGAAGTTGTTGAAVARVEIGTGERSRTEKPMEKPMEERGVFKVGELEKFKNAMR